VAAAPAPRRIMEILPSDSRMAWGGA
jgi:hypothetical protein